jgi:hypothetical protein
LLRKRNELIDSAPFDESRLRRPLGRSKIREQPSEAHHMTTDTRRALGAPVQGPSPDRGDPDQHLCDKAPTVVVPDVPSDG